MAEKQSTSRAQKAVSEVKRKSASTGKNVGTKGAAPKQTTSDGKNNKASATRSAGIPSRAVGAAASILLFIVFLVIAIKPDGALLQVFQSVLLGTIGKAGFYFAIPGLLYLFIIFAFSGKQPVKMRAICLISFVLLSSCIYHLAVNNQTFVGGLSVVSDLYTGGIKGTSGGIICGSIAMLIRWLCGGVLSYVLFILVAIFTLLASMKITIPSIIRAIRNRPREEFEEDVVERPDPASLVVNHLANKRIEHQRRQREMMRQEQYTLVEENTPPKDIPVTKPDKVRERTNKASDMMSQIDGEIGSPVAAASKPVVEETITIVPDLSVDEMTQPALQPVMPEEPIPEKMPAFRSDEEIPAAPVLAKQEPTPEVIPVPAKVTAKDAAVSAMEVAAEIERAKQQTKPEYCFPPIDLLRKPANASTDGTAEMRENSRRLNETLASFRIDAHIINVTRGPSVTRYEVELDKGVRLNKLTSCADDIALSLGASGVRIAAVPGRISVVGIEVPNKVVTNVSLREVIDSNEFNSSKSKSTFAVGKDIGGNCIIGNIAKMPHMLIAGTTGSGKSVCMNSIIISLLYKASPEEVKLIMVDPKMVELSIYNNIPHLLIPVVTDPKKAAGSLQWAVTEMLRRYKIMSDAGVRDLESYNSIISIEEEGGEKLPQVVVIIDELADLMLVAAKEVEDSICRIAQMGRAAGIHLVIATQRPSADVITGLMKANIPSRIAFSVASAMESRIILDTQGAEKLVGKGDMLFAPIGIGKPQRVQGCFVTDGEVEAVANYVKEHYLANYDQQVMEEIEKKAAQTGKKAATADAEPNEAELDGDEMLPAAVDVILETGQASVSMLQRRLKLGYARAARIVDEMEEKGIVGPFQGSKPREILITKEQWQARQSGASQQMEFDDLPFDMELETEDTI